MAAKQVIIKYRGSGADILGRYILWAFLTLITVGIYGPWALNNFYRYVIEHVDVEIPD